MWRHTIAHGNCPYNGLSVLPRCHSRGKGSVRGPCTCTSSQVTAAPGSCPPCTLRSSWAGAAWRWATKRQSNRGSDFEGHFKTSCHWMLHPPAFFHTCTDFPKLPSWQLFWKLSLKFSELFLTFSSDSSPTIGWGSQYPGDIETHLRNIETWAWEILLENNLQSF